MSLATEDFEIEIIDDSDSDSEEVPKNALPAKKKTWRRRTPEENKRLKAEIYKAYYAKNWDKIREKRKYIPHPRDYRDVNFKKPSTGYRNISQTTYGTYEITVTSNRKRHVKTVKTLEEAIEVAQKMRNEFFSPK